MKQYKVTDYKPSFQPAYLANGIIGLRIPAVPVSGGTALVNSFVGIGPELNAEQYADAPYPLGLDIELCGIKLSQRPECAVFIEQIYDFSCGELLSKFQYKVNDSVATVEVVTLCCRSLPMLAIQQVTVTVNKRSPLKLYAQIEHEKLPGKLLKRYTPGRDIDSVVHWQSRGELSSIAVAYNAECSTENATASFRNNFCYEEEKSLKGFAFDAEPGVDYSLQQIAAMVPSEMHCEPHWQAFRMVNKGRMVGFETLRKDNADCWQELWKGRVRLIGADEKWQDLADSSFFYLHSSIHQSTPCSIAPFGLSDRDHYSGRVFWDTETFMYPPLVLTAPEAARACLEYRSRMISGARNNARLNGCRGLQFPWQSQNKGDEMSSFWTDGFQEYHISMDIAFAFMQYVYASDNDLFFKQEAWPVIEGVAEWITSVVKKTEQGYEIHNVIGPDESIHNINNNSFTNIAAIVILREAIKCAEKLSITPPAHWQDVADNMFIPVDENNVIMKHDNYEFDGKLCIPETLLAFFPYAYETDKEIENATYKYNLEKAYTYLGGPMFSSLCGVWAARTGDRKLALDMFDKGVLKSMVEPFNQFTESAVGCNADIPWLNPVNTVFLSNCAGFLMCCMYGLTGLQLTDEEPEQWFKWPVVMPDGWQGIEIDRIFARGKRYSLKAHHGDQNATIRLID